MSSQSYECNRLRKYRINVICSYLQASPTAKLTVLTFFLKHLRYLLSVLLGTFNVRYSLFADGYQRKSAGKLNYWINLNGNTSKSSSTSTSNTRLPIFFFHGIGGVFSYLKLLNGFTIFGCPIVIVEMPYVSLHVAPDVPSIDEHVGAVKQILDENGFDGAIIVGHSFGTTVMSWLVQAMPKRIAGAVFLDPVVFMLHLRDISFNWMYGSVTNVGHKSEDLGVEDIFGIVKTELFAANAVQRHFNWARNILWAHELQEKEVECLVLVSGGDKVVPSLEVVRHIEEHNRFMASSGQKSYVDSEVFDEAGHGGLVFEEGYRSRALKSIGIVVEKSHENWLRMKNTAATVNAISTEGDVTVSTTLVSTSL
jgi:pimeloyl-ACP methyl ester carboxylesterase